MSNLSVYLKSDPNISGGQIDLGTYAYKDYELTIYPVNGRALNVSSSYNISDKTITFNNLIKYDLSNNKVYEWKNNSWNNEVTNYFDINYTGIKVYENNLYTSIKTDIISGTLDINKPWFYMMYGPSSSEDVSRVKTITFQNNIYTFTSDIGKVEFDNKGNPVRSLTTTDLQTVPSLRLVVYKYNGFSQMTSSYLNNLYNTLPNVQSCKNGDTQFVYYSGCGVNILQYNIYIYGRFITSVAPNGNGQRTVHKIYKNLNDPNWDLLFFISDDGLTDKGIAFKLNGTPVKAYQRRSDGWGQWDITADVGYRIYRKDGFTNFTPTVSTKVIPIDIINTITRDIAYQRVNPTVDNFQITIPNDKPTNRIFVYQSGTNKLVHITDYIPKGTTQTVNINYSQGIKSSVTPVILMPVPQFRLDGNESPFAGWERGGVPYTDKCKQGSIVYNIQGFTSDTPIESMYFNCRDPYTKEVSDGGAWRGDRVNSKFDITKESGYNGLYVNAYYTSNVDQIKFYGADGTTRTVGVPGDGTRETYDYICPNGKIAGFFRRAGGNLDGLQAYCASPTIS